MNGECTSESKGRCRPSAARTRCGSECRARVTRGVLALALVCFPLACGEVTTSTTSDGADGTPSGGAAADTGGTSGAGGATGGASFAACSVIDGDFCDELDGVACQNPTLSSALVCNDGLWRQNPVGLRAACPPLFPELDSPCRGDQVCSYTGQLLPGCDEAPRRIARCVGRLWTSELPLRCGDDAACSFVEGIWTATVDAQEDETVESPGCGIHGDAGWRSFRLSRSEAGGWSIAGSWAAASVEGCEVRLFRDWTYQTEHETDSWSETLTVDLTAGEPAAGHLLQEDSCGGNLLRSASFAFKSEL